MPTSSENKGLAPEKPLKSSGLKDCAMLIGYARVSTQDQNLELQIEALTKAGCRKIFEDKEQRQPGRAARSHQSAGILARRRHPRRLETRPA